MSDENEQIAPVLRLVTPAQTDVISSSRHCRHVATILCGDSRRVSCAGCGALLDAFDVLMSYADGERNWRYWESEARTARLELAELKAEERRVKARVAGALRRDADHAVAEERSKTIEQRRAIAGVAKQVVKLGWQIMRLARVDGAEPDNVDG